MLLLIFFLLPIVLAQNYTFETKYVEVPVDHFNFKTNTTFSLKYLVNDTFFKPNGTIFIYTGGELEVEVFAQNSGFLYEIAPQFDALIVFAEHRYYGESLPFGNESFASLKNLGYLNSRQALADYVYLINELQQNYTSDNAKKLPAVAFGGSYSGMLAAWLKMKYPNSVIGSLASSAPIWLFKDQTPCDTMYKIVTQDFETLGSEKCRSTIEKSWKVIRNYTSTDQGKSEIADLWNLCAPVNATNDIVDWLYGVYIILAEMNYPYPTNYVRPLPGNPIEEYCKVLDTLDSDKDLDLLKVLGDALQIYTNYTGTNKCNEISTALGEANDITWSFQECTELLTTSCSRDEDMFENYEYNFTAFSERCFETHGIRPRSLDLPILEYGDKDLSAANNIIFSNGLVDPCSGYGVLTNASDWLNTVAIVMEDAPHHMDLRASNENDPSSVKQARGMEIQYIQKWVDTESITNRVNMWLLILLSIPLVFAQNDTNATAYTFDTKYLEVPLDHFTFIEDTTYLSLKYLVNDTFFGPNGTILFYTGGETAIELYAQNSGFIFEIAPQLNALIVFAEHRYYGESLPFGNESFSSPENLGYLMTVRKKIPAVAFGGSYSGMLAAWLKMKYPNSVIGALASSAPIWSFKNQAPCNTVYKIVTEDFETLGSQKCRSTIEKSWGIIRNYTSTDAGKSDIANLWNFCDPAETSEITEWLSGIYIVLAEMNYPYPTNFITPLPANPIQKFCAALDTLKSDEDLDLLKALGSALQIYTNYTGTTKCNQAGLVLDQINSETAWAFQECTELIFPECSRDEDMFENHEFDFEAFSDICFERFGVRPRSEEVPLLKYGDKDLSTANNVIFTNGLLDPCSGNGVLTNTNVSLGLNTVVIVMSRAAHHMDIRASNENDPDWVKQTRVIEIHHIQEWVNNYYNDDQ
ncbi:hypothetical protein NQ315_007084 [Exocentrus adspersus]|uniref:Lysosomal Pro-X carboxypeptidase n=1 Tax=Exocentrus adspersus TaxID=1586481 RepID=A0AAV8WDG1_9CUCU|nr:hypothetical protein NQ315_007084 [Exocentrus adspersus]